MMLIVVRMIIKVETDSGNGNDNDNNIYSYI